MSSDEKVAYTHDTHDLDERRRAALSASDNAGFSWFYVRIVLVAGVGFFTDAYDLFAINIASRMLGYVYGPQQSLTANQDLGIKVAAPVGTLVGQLLFGYLADHYGRKRMYGIELLVMIVATFGQSLAGRSPSTSIIGVLIVWRFLMGVGIGGDYPLSAIISSEFSNITHRGRLMTAVFAAQGWGNFTAALVALIVVQAYKHPLLEHDTTTNLKHVDPMWRILIGIGCIPACVALYFRLTISETPRFTMDIERNVRQAALDIQNHVQTEGKLAPEPVVYEVADLPKASWGDFAAYFSQWKNLKILIGTAYSWFALDIAFYGLGLNSSIILQTIGFGTPPVKGVLGVYQNLKNICIGNLILAVAGLIPGYYATYIFVDKWGRKPIQLMGFIVLTVLFIIMGFGYRKLIATSSATKAFVFLYCLANFFQNFGPNTTTFIIPGEVFPTRYRSTAHGISAASGKLGAIVAQVGFARLKDIGGKNAFVGHILEIFALFMLTGIFSTLLLPETKGKSLEELSGEDQTGFVRGTDAPTY
jgi:PHS family inorganic phosphate transporter-like MFS transporter